MEKTRRRIGVRPTIRRADHANFFYFSDYPFPEEIGPFLDLQLLPWQEFTVLDIFFCHGLYFFMMVGWENRSENVLSASAAEKQFLINQKM